MTVTKIARPAPAETRQQASLDMRPKGAAMSRKKFHLAWFASFVVDEWNEPFSSAGGNPWTGDFYIEFAKALERACFDYIILEDTLMVPESYGGNAKVPLTGAIQVPKHDPVPLAAVIGSHTSRLGVVATMSTLGYPPFLLARVAATIDHLARGRFGWNIVTSGEDTAAQNFGLDKLPPHDLRYEMADEYMDVVNQLFASWDPDAVVMDRKTQTYADWTKVRPIHFEGKYFKSRGPLNTAPSPQGRPTYVQAGASERGRDFAAKHADSVIAAANGTKAMKELRDDIRARAVKLGRNPDDIKVLYLFSPVMGETEEEAKMVNERGMSQRQFAERRLSLMSGITDIDFSKFDMDKPLPEDLTTNGESSSLKRFAQLGSGKTLRQLIKEGGKSSSVEVVGTPDQVAAKMGEIMEEVGGDGFLLRNPFHHINRRYILEVTDGLVPALQRLDLVRTEYTKPTLRETLMEF
jgi:FMN-dependent oxidoreductase (nitrilotriacetate monooxygenase family)